MNAKKMRYYRHKIENLLVVGKIVTVHCFDFQEDFDSGGEAHDFWEMVYVGRDEILCTAEDREFYLRSGEVIFHRPNEFHRLRVEKNHAPQVVVFSFECHSEAMRFFDARCMKIPGKLRSGIFDIVEEARATFNIPVSNPALRKMELLPFPILGGQQVIKNRLELFLIGLMRNASDTEEEVHFLRPEEVGRSVASRILTVMKENVTENLSVEQLCDGIAYSRSYIFKLFKQETGETILSRYIRMKIEYAGLLLSQGEENLQQITDLLHFDSVNYFSKTFKRYMGMTPRHYIRCTDGKHPPL